MLCSEPPSVPPHRWNRGTICVHDVILVLPLTPSLPPCRWNRGTICVHDVIMGSFWAEVYGKVSIVNRKTGRLRGNWERGNEGNAILA